MNRLNGETMSRFDNWLDLQLRLVDDGVACATIILEGPDGSPWGTWPSRFPNLGDSIDGIMSSFARELPRGKHACKLLALASDKTQISVYPMTVVGASQEATDSVQQQLTLQRAASLFIANAERSQKGLETMLTRTAEIAESVCRANAVLTDELTKLRESTSKERHEFMREEGKQQRMNGLMTQLGPLLELAGGVLSQGVADWMDAKAKANQGAEKPLGPKPDEPAPSVAETVGAPPAVAVESDDEAGSDEPPVARPARGDLGAPIVASDARGRNPGNGVVPIGRSRPNNPKANPSGGKPVGNRKRK